MQLACAKTCMALAGQIWGVQNAGQDWSLQTGYDADGELVIHQEVRPGDLWVNDVPGRVRAELCGWHKFDFGTPVHVSFRLVLSALVSDPTWLDWGPIVFQVHADDLPQAAHNSPPFALYPKKQADGSFDLMAVARGGNAITEPNAIFHEWTVLKGLKALTPYDVSMALVLGNPGSVSVTVNGQGTSFSGPIGYSGAKSYCKFGLYGGAALAPSWVEHSRGQISFG